MTLIYRIGIAALIFIVATLGGFFFGQKVEQVKIAKASIAAYQNASEIQNEINNLDDYTLCLLAGGLPDTCKVFMRRLDKTTQSE